MKQIIRELKRQAAGEKLEPEQLKGLIRAGYIYRIGDEHLLTDMGRDALSQPGVYPGTDAPPPARHHGTDTPPAATGSVQRRRIFASPRTLLGVSDR
jgi:hypothetical protein